MSSPAINRPELIPSELSAHVLNCNACARNWNSFISFALLIDMKHVEASPESILAEAERIINGPRKEAYGPPKESFDKIAAGWSLIVGTPVTAKQVALCMIWLKVVRHTQGAGRDDLVDIAGYAGLSENL